MPFEGWKAAFTDVSESLNIKSLRDKLYLYLIYIYNLYLIPDIHVTRTSLTSLMTIQ